MTETLPVWHLYLAAVIGAACFYAPFLLLGLWIWVRGRPKARRHVVKNDARLTRKANERVRALQ